MPAVKNTTDSWNPENSLPSTPLRTMNVVVWLEGSTRLLSEHRGVDGEGCSVAAVSLFQRSVFLLRKRLWRCSQISPFELRGLWQALALLDTIGLTVRETAMKKLWEHYSKTWKKNNKLNFLWTKMARWEPLFDPESPRKSFCESPFFAFFPRRWGTWNSLFLGAQNGGFGWGTKSLCWRSLCLFCPLLHNIIYSTASLCRAPRQIVTDDRPRACTRKQSWWLAAPQGWEALLPNAGTCSLPWWMISQWNAPEWREGKYTPAEIIT